MAEPTKKLTIDQKLDAIAFSNRQANEVARLQREQKLKDKIAASTKSKRGPANAGRVQGLQYLRNTLGTQFS